MSDTATAASTGHLSPAELLAMLARLGIEYKNHEHEAVFTVEESRHVKEAIPGAHTKNLFVKDKKDNYFSSSPRAAHKFT